MFADGTGAAASFSSPPGVTVDASGKLYVADYNNNRIRSIDIVGLGQLAVTWGAPGTFGSSPITGYTASATAAGHATQTCTTTGATSCTIRGLASAVAYGVTVVAINAAGMSAPSTFTIATPN